MLPKEVPFFIFSIAAFAGNAAIFIETPQGRPFRNALLVKRVEDREVAGDSVWIIRPVFYRARVTIPPSPAVTAPSSEGDRPPGILLVECGFLASLRMTLVCHCEPSKKAWQSVPQKI